MSHTDFTPQCPLPIGDYPQVQMAHGGGGRLMHQLIAQVFGAAFSNPLLDARHDGAVLEVGGVKLAFTTDSYVVRPLMFPGGDIGTLAVNGTVNDLAMCGATPLYLSVGCILEEGLPVETLRRITASMQTAAAAAGVQVVTGDTKVVDRGRGDGIYLNTAGIGVITHDLAIGPGSIEPGDVVLVNGDVGRHGIAIMATREGLAFESEIASDCAPLHGVVAALLAAGVTLRCLRDCTRGGLATTLIEIAESAGRAINLVERAISVREDVQGACELLGLDPLYVANEGRFVAIVPADDAERALAVMRAHPHAAGAVGIGTVGEEARGRVTLTSKIGAARIVEMLSGEQLPRIC
jgi:hydrogenase expression/formation protein HypE